MDDDLLDIDANELAQLENVAPRRPATKCDHVTDIDALQTYIYPTNLPVRDYQYNIVARALFHNVLVALPTGLGKTFIASTVMLNFLRFFPELKVIFMAPTKPLVAQQIKACCTIAGIHTSDVAVLLDKTRKNREAVWAENQVFFTTPQVVENDLVRGLVHPKTVALLVIDEAHRAKGNYAYNNVVKFLNRFNRSFRILALTATPASTVEGVQEIVDNLAILKMEVRTEKSIDIMRHLQRKSVERISVGTSDEVELIILHLCNAIEPVLRLANQRKIYEIREPRQINAFGAIEAQARLMANKTIPEGLKWANYFILQLLSIAGQCLRRLNIYGVRSFYSYFRDKHLEFTTKYNAKKSTNHLAAKFYMHQDVTDLLRKCDIWVQNPKFLGHEKLETTISVLKDFFHQEEHLSSRVIIFTEFRESALDIVRSVEQLDSLLKPHIFIGQAKEKEKFDEKKGMAKGKNKKKGGKKEKSQEDVADEQLPAASLPTSSEAAQISGMTQKAQKQLIKDFKAGIYNILVATSIGEEGLDIGEVDLIICFDSTSSPIKNIQRMGRTGRSRDGKIVLLFSSNEEQKFDKAMAGYDYIQNYMMTSNAIKLHPQTRIIPDKFSPKCIEQEVEIPIENLQIKTEDDEDEIIRLASKYMTTRSGTSAKKGTKAASEGKARPGKKSALVKRFFMPEDVTTVFRLAREVAQIESVANGENAPEKRRKLDTPELDGLIDMHLPRISTQDTTEPDLAQCSSKKHHAAGSGSTKDKSTGQSTDQEWETKATYQLLLPSARQSKDGCKISETPKKDILSSLKNAPIKPDSGEYKLTNSLVKSELCGSPDDLSDGGDEDIMALARQSSSIIAAHYKEKLFKNVFAPTEGYLNSEDRSELYMNYFTPVEARLLENCYNPLKKSQAIEIPHSVASLRILDFQKRVQKAQWELFEQSDIHAKEPELPDFIDF